MCTVSLVPIGRDVRLVCNRDERRSRPAAQPPQTVTLGPRRAVFPIDPVSGGTWVGVNDAGLVLAVLNRVASAHPAPTRSRGEIVPWLLRHGHLAAVVAGAQALPLTAFAGFRVVAAQGATVAELTSDRRQLASAIRRLSAPQIWTSSSLGDRLVERPRRALFAQAVRQRAPGEWPHAQDRFHRHQWPDWPAVSVVMDRADACTVSRTVIDVAGAAPWLRYEALGLR